jgi:osmoprotectant transport system permease protein
MTARPRRLVGRIAATLLLSATMEAQPPMAAVLSVTAPGILVRAMAALVQDSTRPVIVASKPFGESYLLAEMFAQLLQANGLAVDRRLGLGATEIAFGALRQGAIDVYPEYTGTGLIAILGEQASGGPTQVFGRVSRAFAERFGTRWLPPLGFENTYAIAVRRATADSLGLHTLSDLARVGRSLRGGLTPDFIGRSDGLVGLQKAYAFQLKDVRALLPAVKYRALAAGEVDVIDGYSTDGLIARYGLAVLVDDRGFFPPYEAAALVSDGLVRRSPRAIAALTLLSGRLDVMTMRALNERVEVRGEAIPDVARDALRSLGLIGAAAAGSEPEHRARREGLGPYLWERRTDLLRMTGRHLVLAGTSLLAAILLAVPLALLLERRRRIAEGTIRVVGLMQTIPGIALLAFMIPLFGIGVGPALAALVVYAILPILRNTYSGVRDASPSAVNAATALGMTPLQVVRHVRLPLAAPVIMAGIRTAAVINVGTATLAAFVGAGGLGDPIVAGLALSDTRMILSGAIPAALLALSVDLLLAGAERAVAPNIQ